MDGMHVRNVFSVARNLHYLSEKYDFLAPFVRPKEGNENDKFAKTINFQDTLALRALAQALLMDEYGLRVEFPVDTLVPRIPHMLEYILWLEDFIQEYEFMQPDIKGIDIGTGGSAIYALLGAKKNNWKMLATETNQSSSECAIKNIKHNGLTDLIKVKKVAPGSIFADITSILTTSSYTFVMCNPPFFDAEEFKVIGHQRSDNCPRPSGGSTGNSHELSSCGGEVQLVNKMINESVEYSKNITLFTTMIGVVRHLNQIKETFQQLGISNFLVKEKVCGETRRWYIAWSFDERVILQSDKPDIVNEIECFPTWINLENLILEFLSDINIKWTKVSKRSGDCIHIVAYESSWRQQRKRERAKQSESPSLEVLPSKIAKLQSSCAPNEEQAPSESDCIKLHDKEIIVDSTILESQGNKATTNAMLDVILTVVQNSNESSFIYFTFRGGSLGKQGLQELNQCLINYYDEKAKSLQENLSNGESLSLSMSSETYPVIVNMDHMIVHDKLYY